ncbi:MAG: iron ABC transporter permease [Chloroflexi bacterium]|nr:iron ABC transporter permease [Chloroflexota bacterium]
MSASVLPSSLVRPTRRLWRTLARPHVVVAIVLLTLLLYLVITPLLIMIQTTITWQPEDVRLVRGITPGELTTFHWERVFNSIISQTMLWTPLQNTLITSIGISIFALTIGSLLAWLVVRTDLPGKNYISSIAIIPYMLPSWTISLAWIVVFKNQRIGGSIGFLEALTGIQVPDWLSYGPAPIIITLSLHYYAFAFLLVSGALQSLDARLEESGEMLGASRWQVLSRITFPLVIPAILSAFILTFSRAMGSFGTPAFLGNPVRYYVLSTTLYNNIASRLQADGFVLGLVLIAISIVTIYFNQRIIGVRKSYATLTGKGFTSTPIRLRAFKYPLLILVVAFLMIAVVAPLGFLGYQSLMLRKGVYSLDNMTLHFWIGESNPKIADGIAGILTDAQTWVSTWNSVALALSVGGITSLLGIFLGYAVVKGRGTWLSKIVEQVAFLPYLMPSIAFGAIYIGMFAQPLGPLPALYGTFWILVVVSVAKNLPYSSRAGTAAMLQVGSELEEAALVGGASWLTRFRRIIIPLTSSGLVSGFLLTFITSMRELSLIVLLVTPATRTLTTLNFRYSEQGYHQPGDALAMMLVAIILLCEWLVRRFRGGQIGKGLGA